ncbi:unnamed protein product [Urochloa decumbens]|uniref:Leucine-rich repeat-containing N-terminal plant-type domain-containing protein n=1 Tax=Urochloa decumbens TaxID=240449 RepID=A0ABC9DU25_9POAL
MRGRMQGLLTALVLCYFMILLTARKASSCITEERDALLAFKAGITGSGGELSSWQGQDCCKWSGVACSKKTFHIIKLDVSQYSLKGEINSSLAALTRLLYLDLSRNDFGGAAIPEFVGGFKKLRYLGLSQANFGGKVPPQLGNLSTLKHLDLNSFNFPMLRMDSFLWVSRLTSLRYLDLGWVYLAASSDWLQALSKLSLLQVLRLNDASLPATNLNSISFVNFTALTVLNLTNNALYTRLPNWIWRLHSLSYLDLSSCQLSGSVPDKIGNLTSLKFLQLRNNHLTGEIPRAMRRLCSLNHIDLSMNHLFGDTEVEKNMFLCMKQLQVIDFGFNKITGSLSGWLEDWASVTSLDISNNLFSGNVPENIGKLLPNLTYLDLSSNAFEGVLSEVHFDNLIGLKILSLASNSLKILIEPNWMPPFQLKGLGLHGCRVGPHFPTWLRSQTEIEMVDLGSTEIRGTLPDWLWNFSSSVVSLDVSNNSITGQLPTSLEQMKMLEILNMRSNQLVGRIPELPTSVHVLDLSGNCLSGTLPHDLKAKKIYYMVLSDNLLSGRIPAYLCKMVLMEILVLSNNSFSGVLPDCWQKVSRLQTIDLSKNKLHGEIPLTMGSITSLAMLSLRGNSLSGNFPTSLQSCRGLIFLDLAHNKLSGSIPTWVGDSQWSLLFLSLRSNQFSGEIPEKLSQLRSLQFLDLAGNNLSGPVPLSIGNLTSMQLNQDGFQEYADEFTLFKFTTVYDVISPHLSVYIGTDSSLSTGRLLYQFVMTNIDLSRNQLTGQIPKGIGALSSLVALNLSGNQIGGSIPEEIGNLGLLVSLDLSLNHLTGFVPPCISNLTYLSRLDLSYNNILGTRIPSSCQLDTLFLEDPYVYSGNANPYGPQLSRKCSQHHGKHQHKVDRGTYLCAMLGFACGLFTVSVILLFSATTRKSYFQFSDSKLDEFRTAVVIKLIRAKAGRDHSMEARRVCSHNSITCYELEVGSPAPGH